MNPEPNHQAMPTDNELTVSTDWRDVIEGDARAAVVCGDCLDVLGEFPAGSIGALVTDPPYGIMHKSRRESSWKGTSIAGDKSLASRDTVLHWARLRSLPWAAFGSWVKRDIPEQTRGVLVWDKGPATGMGNLTFPWKPSWEEIYIGGPLWGGRRDEGVLKDHLIVSSESMGRVHPHEKPVSLMCHILEKLPSGIVVLDPFCGSGTTGVACAQTGRRFIGIEINHGYAEIARHRIDRELSQGKLFA